MKPSLFCFQTDQQTPVKQPLNILDNLEWTGQYTASQMLCFLELFWHADF